jgi:SAM-dependent methyltransferase
MASDERYQIHEDEYKGQLPKKGASDLYYNRVVRKVKSGKVLDAGCGTGYLLQHLNNNSPSDLYGIDLGIGALRIAKYWLPEANFCLTNILNIPFKSNSFDCVVCAAVLEHMDEKQGNAAVRECFRVLKPGGTGLFLVPTGKGIGDTVNPEHIQSFTYDGLLKLLGNAGFEIIGGQKFGLYLPLISPFLELLLRISHRRIPISAAFNIEVPQVLSAELLAECRKPAE